MEISLLSSLVCRAYIASPEEKGVTSTGNPHSPDGQRQAPAVQGKEIAQLMLGKD